MPFPRTWSEELIAEWLQLKGYFVEAGVPLRSGKAGGRTEADIIGVKSNKDVLEIYHIEVGSLSGNPQRNEEMIREKFSEQRVSDVIEYCIKKLNSFNTQQANYKNLYVAVWWSDRTMKHLKNQNLPVISLWDLIHNEIKPTINHWKKHPTHKTQTKGKTLTLPEGMWLLYLIDYLLSD